MKPKTSFYLLATSLFLVASASLRYTLSALHADSNKLWNALANSWSRTEHGTENTHLIYHHALSSGEETEGDTVVLNVVDFGAIGDDPEGGADDTEAVRRALRYASSLANKKTTVTILFPENRIFSTGPLNLTSMVTLQVDGILRALNWTETEWPQIPPLVNYGTSEDAGFYLQYQSFLYANDAHDIKITGNGIIDGQGQAWWDAFKNHAGGLTAGRPNLVQFINCKNIEVAGVTLKDSPFWCLHPVLCSDVHIHHIKIRSHIYAENSDGIDPDSSRNVLIEDNDISCGDDHIAIKAGLCGKGKALDCDKVEAFTDGTYETVNITIRRNIFGTGMGIALGSECSGGIRDVLIEDNLVGVCKPGHCEVGCCGWSPGMHLKTTDTRGGHIENIMFRNNTVYNTTGVIFLETDYQTNSGNEGRPTVIKNLTFQSNKGRGTAEGISFHCSKDLPCENITFFDNDFHPTSIGCEYAKVIDENGKNVCSDDEVAYDEKK